MTKKIKIIIAIVCVILLGIGFVVWSEYGEYKRGGDIFSADDFTVQISDDEKIIENKEIGLTLKVPNDWKTGEFIGGSLLLLPSNYKENPNDSFPKEGCLFVVSAITYGKYEINGALDIQKKIERLSGEASEGKEKGFEEIVIVDGRQAYKEVEGIRGKSENYEAAGKISVEIPRLEKPTKYQFEVYCLEKNFEQCQREFDQILATVKIK